MGMLPKPEEMRKRFKELTSAVGEVRVRTTPLRAARDKLLNETQVKLQKMESEYMEIEKGLYDMEQDRAALARALGGRV